MLPTRFFLATAILMLAVDASSVPGIKTYRNVMGIGRYKLHTEALFYSSAAEECAKEEAQLAVPTSQEAEEVLKDIMRAADIRAAFIGVNDLNQEGKMETVKGELYSEVGFSRWMYGEPNNVKDEDCVLFTWDGLLYDYNCKEKQAFFCEKDRLLPHNPY